MLPHAIVELKYKWKKITESGSKKIPALQGTAYVAREIHTNYVCMVEPHAFAVPNLVI